MTPDNSGMPPLPTHPEPHTMAWTGAERLAIFDYGRQVAQMCAEICQPWNYDRPSDWTEHAKTMVECADAIRARFGLEKP